MAGPTSALSSRKLVRGRPPMIGQDTDASGVQTETVVCEVDLDFRSAGAKGPDADEGVLELGIRLRWHVAKGQTAMENDPVGSRLQGREIAHKPQVGVSDWDRQSATQGSDRYMPRQPALVGSSPA